MTGSGTARDVPLAGQAGAGPARNLDADGDGPRTPTEQRLAALWEGLLGITGIRRSANFFTIGGQSLLAMRMIARVRNQFGVRVPARAIFDRPTLCAFAGLVNEMTGAAVPSTVVDGDTAAPDSSAMTE